MRKRPSRRKSSPRNTDPNVSKEDLDSSTGPFRTSRAIGYALNPLPSPYRPTFPPPTSPSAVETGPLSAPALVSMWNTRAVSLTNVAIMPRTSPELASSAPLTATSATL